MATADSVKAKLQGLIDKSNATTGNTDADLTTAVDALVAGFGQGGGGAELNIAYGDTAPEDTSKLWVKTTAPNKVVLSGLSTSGGATYAEDQCVSETLLSTSYRFCDNCCATVGSYVYSFGGYQYTSTTKSTLKSTILKITKGSVTQLSVTAPVATNELLCAAVGTKIYLFWSENIYCFDTEEETMTTLSVKMPVYITDAACAAVGTKIYLFGGSRSMSTIYCFDTEEGDEGAVNTISTPIPSPCIMAMCAAVDEKIYLLGGFNSSVGFLTDIQCFDTTNNSMTIMGAKLQTGKVGAGCAAVGDKIVVYGGVIGFQSNGSSYEGSKTMDVYDVSNDIARRSSLSVQNPQWAAIAPHPTIAGAILVVGGCGNSSSLSNETPYNFNTYTQKVTLASDVVLEPHTLYIHTYTYSTYSAIVWNALQSDAVDITVVPKTAHKADADGVGQIVEMALYKNGAWATI